MDQPPFWPTQETFRSRTVDGNPEPSRRYIAGMLLEIGSWQSGHPVSQRHITKLFRAREFIAFSALSARLLFRSFDYCNLDTYALTVQQFGSGSPGTFSFATRRRDGGTQHLWSAKEFTFLKPLHVDFKAKAKIDSDLLRALVKADRAGRLSYEAIVEFNRANTDSTDVPSHTEVVLTKSAFEFFFSIGNKRDEFVHSLLSAIPKPIHSPSGPLLKKWETKYPRARRPIEAWAREFCDLRGSAAHGKNRGGKRFIWSEHAHLAFASMLFPLQVKGRLVSDGFMKTAERDSLNLEFCESYLMHNPFVRTKKMSGNREHPWSKIFSENVLGEVMRRQLVKIIRESK